MFEGLRVIEDASMVDVIGWDYSGCRSPSRAKRRFEKRGIQGRVRELTRPQTSFVVVRDMIVGHPATVRRLMAQASPAAAEIIRGGIMTGAIF